MKKSFEDMAREYVENMDMIERLRLLANPDDPIELEEEAREHVFNCLKEYDHNFIECSNWHLLSREYMVLADVEDLTSDVEQNHLEDKMEAFEIPWIRYPGKYWSINDDNKYGIFFLKVPKWCRDKAEKAFDAYYKWLCWRDHDFRQMCREIVYDFIASGA